MKETNTALLSRALKALVIASIMIIGGCDTGGRHQGSILREAQKRGAIRVVTLNSPTTYYQSREGGQGFEYDLAKVYARHLGLELQIVTANTIETVLLKVGNDEADFAAAGLTITRARQQQFRFSPSYLEVETRLICNRKSQLPKTLAELNKVELRVAPGSSFIDVLQGIKDQLPYLEYTISENATVETLLAQIGHGQRFCTLADSHVFALNQRYLPELTSPMALSPKQPIAWALGGGLTWRSISLQRDMKAWFNTPEAQVLLKTLKERYFQVSENEFDYVDIARFRRAIRQRLPKYESIFKRAARRYKVPWELLTAISWRESHWRPNAKSHTGVRGMMMLTLASAKEAGVTNRLDAKQSIFGGARYFARLLRRLPGNISTEDRPWFALAAYNMGYAHLTDAMALAKSRGLNPNLWRDVRTVLPDMENPKVYQALPRGYANGRQAQDYVAAVRNFYDILRQSTQKQTTQ